MQRQKTPFIQGQTPNQHKFAIRHCQTLEYIISTTLPLPPLDPVNSEFPRLQQSSKENASNPDYLCTKPLIYLLIKPCHVLLGKTLANIIPLFHPFQSLPISQAGFWLLLNSEVFAVVRMEDRRTEGMKYQRIQQNQLSTAWLQSAEDQRKPLTHTRGNVWQQEVPASQAAY